MNKIEPFLGTYILKIKIEKDGKIGLVTIERGSVRNLEIEQKVIEVFQNMPKWIPAKENGESVEIEVFLPLKWN